MKKQLLYAVAVFVLTVLCQQNVSAQTTYTMCASATSTQDTSGIIEDSGGPLGDYLVDEDCTLLVAPSCATSITLTFSHFDTESGWDFFHVYDGTVPTGTNEILNVSGSTIPPSVTCTSGAMLIVWHSDFTIVASGFTASWTSVIAPSVAPTAAFNIGNTNPPLNIPVQFTDASTGSPTTWLWEFGDGDTAKSQNPTHAYDTPGTYTVRLIAFTCNESDTITHNITVQAGPQIDVDPTAGFSASVQCGDSTTFNLDISNIAGGELVYSMDGSSVGAIKVLAMTYGTDQFTEYLHTIAAINQYFTNYALTATGTSDPGVLSGQLVGKNVLLIPEQETGNATTWGNLGPVIRQFLNNGGSVIYLGSYSSYSNCMFNTGVFTGLFIANQQNNTMDINDPTHPLMNGLVSPTFNAPSATYSMDITNPDFVNVVDFNGEDIVGYRIHGSGKAIFIAFDYYDSNDETKRIIANAIEWGGENALPNWIHLSQANDTVSGGATSSVDVTFVASGLPAGTYYANLGINSNDPDDPIVIVPCTLTVSGFPIINLSDSCANIGNVMQHTTVTDTFSVINNGCDTLFISSILSSNPAFTINANFSYLLPGAFSNVIVTFNGTTVGTFGGTVDIDNNDNDTSVCITATTFPAPIVTTSVSSFNQNLRACSDSSSTTFSITNTGGSDLIFTLGTLPPWIAASPASGTIPAGGSQTITLNYGSGTMVGGTYHANVVILSNDPLAPNKTLGFDMNVDFNPCVSYTDSSNTCTGFSTFTTTSINTPTSYHWDFGDGDTSNVANPTHSFASNGTYTVTLVACNASGCDTVVQSINAIITGPQATSCYPVTTAYCCGIGVTLFQLSSPSGFLFNNTSPDAVDNYQDYTCTDTATLLTNFSYNVNIQTGFTYDERVKIWLDMNGDGALDAVNELIYEDIAIPTHTGTINIPSYPTNAYGVPLRLRIASDYTGNPTPEPCLDLQFGQVEDYSVFLNFFTDVNELNNETGFNVYPNPFDMATNIEYNLKNSGLVTVEVFNVVGEKVNSFASTEHQSPGKHSYQFNNASSGIYFVKLSVDGKSSIKKIVKM
jgi:PKD repeat protein